MPIDAPGRYTSAAQMYQSIENVVQDVERAAEKYIRLAAIGVSEQLVNNTPVYTGFAKDNWKISTGTPDRSLRGNLQDAKQASSDIRAGRRQIGTLYEYRDHTAQLSNYKLLYGDVYITNNVVYLAGQIEKDDGWVEESILSGLSYADRA